MNINRNNYEEFFLLYIDNELTPAERTSVEQFIQENPDLTAEMELFRQTSLVSNPAIVYKGKESLMKNENDALITMNNYEEWLIAYLDNELSQSDRKKFERFADSHPTVKEELSIYRQTKFQPEPDIIFANKQVLYRTEEKVRVITMQWWKIAVAAAVVLAIGLTTFTVVNRNRPVPTVVATTGDKTGVEKHSTPADTNTDTKKKEQTVPVVSQNNDAVASIKKVVDKQGPASIQKGIHEKAVKNIRPSAENSNDVIAKTKVPVKPIGVTADKEPMETRIVESSAPDKKDIDASKNSIAINTTSAKQNINNSPVTINPDKPYDNKETAQEITNDTGAVFASNNEEGRNKKLRGFFRKATRVFEKRANISAADDDEQVLIGVLAVRLK